VLNTDSDSLDYTRYMQTSKSRISLQYWCQKRNT